MRPVPDQTILLTGATDGMGRELARELAAQGASLILHGRNAAKGQDLLAELRASTGNDRLSYELADFSSLEDIRKLADRVLSTHDRLDALVNNAGIGVELARQESQDGLELTFQVDYLAAYMLSCRLAPLLVRSAPARIVNVSSAGQAPINFRDVMLERNWDGVQAYCQAKLAQISLTFDLAERLRGTGVTANALHPASYMPTKMVVNLFTPQSTVEEGVRSTLRMITDPSLDDVTGAYFNRTQRSRAGAQAYDERDRARLRALSESLTGVSFPADLSG
ncbi:MULTISPECIES: SDR family NAD(P)-dependent oxidoreductase [unclassified Streptomyces]|uniref:SDR family NAD(P)-dependent oxidoreductase n=1 Tax=unclassified Streptomyces TaxID=2593676 RepID=UPI0029624611|nr:SDR family NAD(P)-dependent oxidoreductase [Streptomyces sp. N50]WOX14308.1 SDR family NAD(P)-dependent oxidoreductase [Streptomyces sp. N50]